MVKKSYCIHLDKNLMDRLKETDDNLSGRINLLIRNYLKSIGNIKKVSTNEAIKESIEKSNMEDWDNPPKARIQRLEEPSNKEPIEYE